MQQASIHASETLAQRMPYGPAQHIKIDFEPDTQSCTSTATCQAGESSSNTYALGLKQNVHTPTCQIVLGARLFTLGQLSS